MRTDGYTERTIELLRQKSKAASLRRYPPRPKEVLLANERRRDMILKYKITPEEFELLKAKQKNRCKICQNDFGPKRNVCIDHNHKTNKIRGLLCSQCNAGIGLLGDNLVALKNAVKYLEE